LVGNTHFPGFWGKISGGRFFLELGPEKKFCAPKEKALGKNFGCPLFLENFVRVGEWKISGGSINIRGE